MNQIFRKKTCPYGQKAVELLENRGIVFEDNIFQSKEEEETFKTKHAVSTTPQIFLDGVRLGGYDKLADHLGEKAETSDRDLRPVVVIFSVSLALAVVTGSCYLALWELALPS